MNLKLSYVTVFVFTYVLSLPALLEVLSLHLLGCRKSFFLYLIWNQALQERSFQILQKRHCLQLLGNPHLLYVCSGAYEVCLSRGKIPHQPSPITKNIKFLFKLDLFFYLVVVSLPSKMNPP